MTIRTRLWRRFIKQDRLPLHLMLQRVALRATDVCVPALQGEFRPFVVIERGGLPSLDNVAIRALRDSILRGELPGMRVAVTRFAILRCSLELDFMCALNRLVALAAGHRAISPGQRELCFRVVETRDVDPRPRVVACLATQGSAVGTPQRHALLEFALVGIRVACRACSILEMERQDFVCASAKANLVAIRARNGGVGASEWKTRVLVHCNREGRTVKVFYGVAVFTTVLIRGGGELLIVRVLVAIGAGRKFHFVNGVFSCRHVAFLASDGCMFPFQRIA
jgi:hypothetical protein